MSPDELEQLTNVEFPSRSTGKTWFADLQRIVKNKQQKITIYFDHMHISGELMIDGFKAMDSPTHGPTRGYSVFSLSLKNGLLINEDGCLSLWPGRYLLLPDRFAYGAPLGWRGTIFVEGLGR